MLKEMHRGKSLREIRSLEYVGWPKSQLPGFGEFVCDTLECG